MLTIRTNLPELINKLKELKNVGSLDYSAALLVGVNAAMAQMQNRIFNTGRDTGGVPFGKYVGKKNLLDPKSKLRKLRIAKALDFDLGITTYEKKRLSRGRQISYKDLEFTGDLRRGIIAGKESNTKVICWIPNDKLYIIAKGQEDQIGKIRGGDAAIIFSLSPEETEILDINTKAALTQMIGGEILKRKK